MLNATLIEKLLYKISEKTKMGAKSRKPHNPYTTGSEQETSGALQEDPGAERKAGYSTCCNHLRCWRSTKGFAGERISASSLSK